MTERRMTAEDQEVTDRNFRSSYYKTLGFKDSEKSISHLEALLKADVFDVKKLKSFCLKHTLTVFYRPLVWKIILSVIPVYSDNDTCSFVREQKKMEFEDLKRAIMVMDKKEKCGSNMSLVSSSSGGGGGGGDGEGGRVGGAVDGLGLGDLVYHSADSSPSTPTSVPPVFIPDKFSSLLNGSKLSPKSVAESSSSQSTSVQDSRVMPQGPCAPRDFVTIYLLQNKRLLSNSINQLKQEEQVDMQAIAGAFFTLFEEESEDEVYWLFANFMRKMESQSTIKEEMLEMFSQTLEDIDCVLLEHIKDLEALDCAIPLQRWFRQCYARDLPESCLGSVWDRFIGGSCMILVYVAVGIIISNKRRILSFSSADQIERLVSSIPQENYGPIVGKAIELWEDSGSPLIPVQTTDEQQSHELMYEIEDYS